MATKMDANTPRGYALLISRIDEGLSEWTEDIVDKVYQCSQCSLCKELCEFHWEEDILIQAGREAIVNAGKAPEIVKNLASLFINSGTACNKPEGELGVSGKFIKEKQADVLYFAGDTALYEQPEIVKATEVILDSMGVNWAMLEKEQSTGVELFELGYTNDAKVAARKLADKIMKLSPGIIITGCAHTYRAFKKLYPQWGIKALSDIQIYHITEYLYKKVKDGELRLTQDSTLSAVSYHDPCQLGRNMGIYEAPRELINAITGRSPIELFHNRGDAECCGSGSVMYLTHPDISTKVAQKRIENALEENAKIVVTACPNCKNIFTRASCGMDGDIRVIDIVELMALRVRDTIKIHKGNEE
ncbi:MAG: (Fe-S)-binding protein [Actinobacteria bacterium]|nr:(Fe-S)-binding protein [Actinomycetota bacterium]